MHSSKEALWLHSLISDVFGALQRPTTLFSYNQAAITLMHNHQYHAWTKHIDVHCHWIRWVIEQGVIKIIYCPTDNMVSNVLTKALPSAKVKHFTTELRLHVK